MILAAIMELLVSPDFWAGWLRIVIIDLLLAGDNALVIALAVRRLGPREQLWGRVFGTAGAVLLRVAFIMIVTLLLRLPLLHLIGGALLVWIAVKLVREESGGPNEVQSGTTLRQAIGIIILADVVMSLDNVIAIAAAARGDLLLIVLGLLLSLPLVVWGSGVLARLMNRLPLIVWFGGGVLGWVAGAMMLDDPLLIGWAGDWLGLARHIGPGALAVAITSMGWWAARGTERARGFVPQA